ncbi:2-dehydropantoate 2-reductase [Halobacillus litoralis]|uniref:2-dehydropantoate 2-reductase n=1 Tax=Halobacillus litoralis TaxID=45668 RepID=UPI001CD60DF2|nr:2-dehydropantoate 2-reductase [Halobacillus litoralis]MCA0969379.1 2-dehydropantoate 2-reductase [Halobacillus litoralis]
MKVAIIGGGAIGLLVGAYLGRSHEVHMYVRRTEQKEALETAGITCQTLEEPTPVHAHLISEKTDACDLVIVAVKQHQVERVVKEQLTTGAPVLFLQNGMGHLEYLYQEKLHYIGVVDHGALKVSDNAVEHLGQGMIQAARYGEEGDCPNFLSSLHEQDFPVYYRNSYKGMMVSKLIVNTVINPLTALFEVKNHALVDNPHIQKIGRRLCVEACRTMELAFEKEWERVLHVAGITGENESSMFKDMKEGRLTEIDAICGYIIRQSKEPLPYHEFVIEAVHAKERREV